MSKQFHYKQFSLAYAESSQRSKGAGSSGRGSIIQFKCKRIENCSLNAKKTPVNSNHQLVLFNP